MISRRTTSASGPRSAGTEGPMLETARHATSASGHSTTETRVPRSVTTKPAASSIASATPGVAMSFSRFIDPWCASGEWRASGRKMPRMSSGGPSPQKLMLSGAPGLRTRHASSSASSHPPQMPLIEIAASKERVRPRQFEHGTEPQIGVGRTGGRHGEELGRGIDARDLRAHASREAHGEAGPAGDVEQAGPRPDAHPPEDRNEHVDCIVLVQAGPVGRSVAPCFAGRLPIVPVTGLNAVVGLGCCAGPLGFCS